MIYIHRFILFTSQSLQLETKQKPHKKKKQKKKNCFLFFKSTTKKYRCVASCIYIILFLAMYIFVDQNDQKKKRFIVDFITC